MNKDKDFVEVHFMKYDSGKILDFGCEMWEGMEKETRRGKKTEGSIKTEVGSQRSEDRESLLEN
jgi:hypothetical protein